MRRYGIILLFMVSVCLTVKAQSNSPSVIASAGGIAMASTLTLEWTMGEYAVETLVSGSKMYTQGFNQPFLIYAIEDKKPAEKNLYTINVFPNPVRTILNFNINSFKKLDVNVSVSDIQGKMYIHRSISSLKGQLQLNFSGMLAGTYLLAVREAVSNKLLKTYQIIRL